MTWEESMEGRTHGLVPAAQVLLSAMSRVAHGDEAYDRREPLIAYAYSCCG
jgi:hypothetical protein